MTDPRRHIPRTDALLAHPQAVAATHRVGASAVKAAVVAALEGARRGELPSDEVTAAAMEAVDALIGPTRLRPVLNATGVVLHTNLGRAPLPESAVTAMISAAGYVDVEFDLDRGNRAARGQGVLAALLAAVPAAEAALVVNNGAAALMLAAAALGGGREVVISRGEMVEIGDGFRLPDLIEASGAQIREVGTTNRTTVADYAGAIGPNTGCLLKIHPSNFRIEGFTGVPTTAELAVLGPPVVVDIGSGLLAPDATLPAEPDAQSALSAGAALVTGSGDKLLGGPQAGIVLGTADLVHRLRRHPLARAVRPGKITLAALEATLTAGGVTPTESYLRANPAALRERCDRLAAALAGRLPVQVVPSDGAVGGGGGTGVVLAGWAVAVPQELAGPLRTGDPAVVGRVSGGRLLLDLRCVPPDHDDRVRDAILAAAYGCKPAALPPDTADGG